jgi:hypothetical protein
MQKLPPVVREAATEEMKKIIAHAYSTNTMLTIHWPSVQLARYVVAAYHAQGMVLMTLRSLSETDPLKNLKRKQCVTPISILIVG